MHMMGEEARRKMKRREIEISYIDESTAESESGERDGRATYSAKRNPMGDKEKVKSRYDPSRETSRRRHGPK